MYGRCFGVFEGRIFELFLNWVEWLKWCVLVYIVMFLSLEGSKYEWIFLD